MKMISVDVQNGWPVALEIEPYGLYFDLTGQVRSEIWLRLEHDTLRPGDELVNFYVNREGIVYLHIARMLEKVIIDGEAVFES